jgi:tetratricopeptide (TPR) repeat protein
MTNRASRGKEEAATKDGSKGKECAVMGVVCALVIGFYAWSANSGVLELMGSGARNSYYNLLVQGFRAGHLSVNREVPPDLGDPAKMKWEQNYGLDDLSYYKGKLYLYFGVTPVLVLFWPYAALTGHYLLHKEAVVIFFSAGFLAGAGLLWSVWRRYFKETGLGVLLAGTLALGLGNFVPAILARCDVYEVAVSCGYALTMLALGGIWCALHDERRRWRWVAAASLAYGLAVGARPSLLLGAVVLLAPAVQAWREKRRLWPLLMAAGVPMVLIGVGLMFYNALRFGDPLEFGQRYQLPLTAHQQFSLRYLWFNFRVGFLEPAHWSGRFPFVDNIVSPAQPAGYYQLVDAFGILTNIPMVWLALAAPLAWRNRTEGERSVLRCFLGAVALLSGMCALPLAFHDSMCLRYELEYASPLVMLAVVGILALERGPGRQAVWRRTVRCGWGLLLGLTVAFNVLASYKLEANNCQFVGFALYQTGRMDEAAAFFKKALQISPDFPLAHNNLGNALLQKGRVGDAIAEFQKALKIEPDYADAHISLGNVLLQTGKVDEAIAHYQQALQTKPGMAVTYNNLGNALLNKGRVDEAIAQFQKALELQPDAAAAYFSLGTALQQRGRLDEAIAQFQMALQLIPSDPTTQIRLAWLLATSPQASQRDGGKALELARQADHSTGGENPAVLRVLATAYAETGRITEAVETAQHALRLAEAKSDTALAGVIRSELKLYQAGSPYHTQ